MTALLTGKVAVVTGANQGLGLEIAHRYLAEGASLALCARNGVLLQEAQDNLSQKAKVGQKIIAYAVDASNPSDVKRFIEQSVSELGKVDILINNAGVYGPKGLIEEVDWADWLKAIEINLFGSILMCRELLPLFKAQGNGKIIQLSGGRDKPHATHQRLCSIQSGNSPFYRDPG